MFKNEHELFMPVLFDSCLCYDSCQSSFRWTAVCYEQITLLSVKGENQPETLIGFVAERVEASSNSQFPACFLWKKLCSLTSEWHKAVNNGKLGWSNSALDVWDPPRPLMWPMKFQYYWWILPITDVLPFSRRGAGVLSTVCTWTALLGNSGTVLGGIFPTCSDRMPQALLLVKWEQQGGTG